MIADRTWPWVGCVALLTATFILSCVLSTMREEIESPLAHRTIAGAVGSETRSIAGAFFYEMADTYFHHGKGHVEVEAFQSSFFQKVLRETAPSRIIHLEGQNMKEMMPWLWLAMSVEPNRVEAPLVAAFFLAGEMQRPDIAHRVLREALINNPRNYEIPLEDGRIYLRENKIEEAKQAFDTGLGFWPGRQDPGSEDAMLGKESLLLYRALLHEVDGENDKAADQLELILKLFPDKAYLRERMEMLRKGGKPSALAEKLIRDSLEAENARRAERHQREHREDGDGHPEH